MADSTGTISLCMWVNSAVNFVYIANYLHGQMKIIFTINYYNIMCHTHTHTHPHTHTHTTHPHTHPTPSHTHAPTPPHTHTPHPPHPIPPHTPTPPTHTHTAINPIHVHTPTTPIIFPFWKRGIPWGNVVLQSWRNGHSYVHGKKGE